MHAFEMLATQACGLNVAWNFGWNEERYFTSRIGSAGTDAVDRRDDSLGDFMRVVREYSCRKQTFY